VTGEYTGRLRRFKPRFLDEEELLTRELAGNDDYRRRLLSAQNLNESPPTT
jgi:hypothetical protein